MKYAIALIMVFTYVTPTQADPLPLELATTSSDPCAGWVAEEPLPVGICVPAYPHIGTGWATYYELEPSVRMLSLAIENGWLPEGVTAAYYDAYIAVADCSKKGESVWIRLNNEGSPWLRAFIYDCLGRDSVDKDGNFVDWMAMNNVIFEVDWWLYGEWRGNGGGLHVQCAGC